MCLIFLKKSANPWDRYDVNSIIEDISTLLHLITIRHDLDTITLILHQTFELPPFKRDYDSAFGKVADILKRLA